MLPPHKVWGANSRHYYACYLVPSSQDNLEFMCKVSKKSHESNYYFALWRGFSKFASENAPSVYDLNIPQRMTSAMYIRICRFLRDKIAGTQWEGHVFTVGGCCRDMVLGEEIKDVDLAVDLPNGGIEFAQWLYSQRLSTWRPVVFERYGTAMLRLRAFPHDDIEIVQTRAEKYTDRNSRNPETAFGSLLEDCLRRDLTINALYYDITHDKLLDICGRSLNDIRHKVIATPLEPDSTYDDDPIRILRTVRFATRLGWEIPSSVAEAITRNVHRLTVIKPERLRGEFEKLLLSANASRALEMLRACGAMKYIVPEVERLHSLRYLPALKDTVWEHSLRTIDMLPADLALRWSALLKDTALPNVGEENNITWPDNKHARVSQAAVVQVLTRLKYYQPLIKDVLFYSSNHETAREWGSYAENMVDADLRRLQFLSGQPDKLNVLLMLIDADNKTLPGKYKMPQQVDMIRMRLNQLHDEGTDMYSYQLPFAERRVKKILNIEHGPLVDNTLEYMMRLAFANPLRSRSEFERLVANFNPHTPVSGPFLSTEIRPSYKRTKRREEPQTETKRGNNRHHRRRSRHRGNRRRGKGPDNGAKND